MEYKKYECSFWSHEQDMFYVLFHCKLYESLTALTASRFDRAIEFIIEKHAYKK
jgi:hypothetical protein